MTYIVLKAPLNSNQPLNNVYSLVIMRYACHVLD